MLEWIIVLAAFVSGTVTTALMYAYRDCWQIPPYLHELQELQRPDDLQIPDDLQRPDDPQEQHEYHEIL